MRLRSSLYMYTNGKRQTVVAYTHEDLESMGIYRALLALGRMTRI